MRFLVRFGKDTDGKIKQPLIIETMSWHILDAKEEIWELTGSRPSSMQRIDDDLKLRDFRSEKNILSKFH